MLRNSAYYEELASNDMGESILATPAIADGKLFIRTRTKLMCVLNQINSRSQSNDDAQKTDSPPLVAIDDCCRQERRSPA